jgi:hypothetical protein
MNLKLKIRIANNDWGLFLAGEGYSNDQGILIIRRSLLLN